MRKRKALLGICVTWIVVAASAVAGGPPRDVEGEIVVVGPVVTSVRQAGPNTIITGSNQLMLTGDIAGAAVYEFRQVNHANGSLNSNGIVTCVCTVDGQTGTLVVRVTGTGSLGPPTLFSGAATVVDADGGLEGLHGVFRFDQVGPFATYTGQIHFEP